MTLGQPAVYIVNKYELMIDLLMHYLLNHLNFATFRESTLFSGHEKQR